MQQPLVAALRWTAGPAGMVIVAVLAAACSNFDLVDPANTALGQRQVQRWSLSESWVISRRPAHPALVSEADFIAVQQMSAPRGPGGPATRRYLLAGLICCGTCGRRLESSWSNGRPAYRRRHGYTSATHSAPARQRTSLSGRTRSCPTWERWRSCSPATNTRKTIRGKPASSPVPAQAAELIDHLRSTGCTLTYDPRLRTLHTEAEDSVAVTIGRSH